MTGLAAFTALVPPFEGGGQLLLQLVPLVLAAALVWRCRRFFSVQRPSMTKTMWGLVAIPEGEQWRVSTASGAQNVVAGPKVVWTAGARLVSLDQRSASNAEYLRIKFVDGLTEVIPGPARVFFNPTVHKDIKVFSAVNLTDHEVLVVYAEEGDAAAGRAGGRVARSLIRGPCLHVPQNATEWVHAFSWHGSSDTDGVARKRRDALKFQKLRTCPDQTYFDVEGVRTRDDALLSVNLMIFFRLQDIDVMLQNTHDPIADFINAVSSDVIDFVAAKSFEVFKAATDQLNDLSIYRQLTSRAERIGFEVTKVVFRGYSAPSRLQKMHDDAIERRTALVLRRETENQEQELEDLKLEYEERRLRQRRQIEKDAGEHEREQQRALHDAQQLEEKEKREAHLQHLLELKNQIGISGDRLAAYIVAVEQGAPEKLIQVAGSSGGSCIQLQVAA